MRVPLRGNSAGLVDQVTGRPLGPNAQIHFNAYGTSPGAGIVWPSGFGVQQDGDSVMADRAEALADRPRRISPHDSCSPATRWLARGDLRADVLR